MSFIAVLESQNPYRCAATIGEMNYAHSTAAGKCLLAYLSEEQIEDIIREIGLPKMAGNTITSGTQLLEELPHVREEGVAVNIEENIDAMICVAAPIRDQSGQPIGALSVSGPAIRMEVILDGVKREVKRVAGRLSSMLGCPAAGDPRPALIFPGRPVSVQ